MLVRLIRMSRQFKLLLLRPLVQLHHFRFALLLGKNGRNRQFSKLQIRTETPQILSSRNQRPRQRQRHITGLHLLDNIILLSLIIQLQHIFKVERSISIVTPIQINQIPDIPVDIKLNLLIKIKRGSLA